MTRLVICAAVCTVAIGVVAARLPAQEATTYSYDPLGRLVGSSISGGPNNAKSIRACFDAAGNRVNYEVKAGAPSACSSSSSPNPPSSGGNQPPSAVADSFSLPCNTGASVNLTQNDTDPEGNLPLTLRSITRASGTTEAWVTSASNVFVDAYGKGSSSFTYVVADSLGATASGTLQVTSTGTALACSGGKN